LAAAAFVHQRSWQAERRNPPAGRFLEVDGVRLHYVERGEGTPLVMLHGLGMVEELVLSPAFALAVLRATASSRSIAPAMDTARGRGADGGARRRRQRCSIACSRSLASSGRSVGSTCR
jgi:hypothetical protein